MFSNCGAGEDSWESLGQQDQPSQSQRKSTPNIHWKDWCWSWSSNILATWCEESTHWKIFWCWKDWKQEEKGVTEDEIIGWYHWLNGLEFEKTLGNGEGQESLACCNPWGPRVGHDWVTEQQQSMGRTVAEAEALILWPPDMKSWLNGKDPNPGKDWR